MSNITTSVKPVFPLSKRQVAALGERLNANPDAAVDGHIVARLLRYAEVQTLIVDINRASLRRIRRYARGEQ